MRVFIAGGTGAIGKVLVPLLVENGHEVIVLARGEHKVEEVEAMGAKAAAADPLDREELTAAIRSAEPEVIMHQLTALSGAGNFRKFDEEFALTNRFRTEVTDTMLAAARMVGARRFIAQSFCGWPFAREGGPVKTEEDPLDANPPASFSKTLAAIRRLEDTIQRTTETEALALRYGMLYGPGTGFARDGSIVDLVRKRRMPIIGDGAGTWSFIHVQDVARATVAAMSRAEPGVYNVVDDDPAPVSTWLPYLADVLDARPPRKLPAWLGKIAIGDGGVSMMTRIRGGSNAKAKREFEWRPIYPTWRRGFVEEFG